MPTAPIHWRSLSRESPRLMKRARRCSSVCSRGRAAEFTIRCGEGAPPISGWLTLGPLPVAEAEQLCARYVATRHRRAARRHQASLRAWRGCSPGCSGSWRVRSTSMARSAAVPESASWYLATDELQTPADLPAARRWLTERELGGLSPSLVAHASPRGRARRRRSARRGRGVIDELREVGRDGDYPLASEVALARLVDVGVLTVDGGRFGFRILGCPMRWRRLRRRSCGAAFTPPRRLVSASRPRPFGVARTRRLACRSSRADGRGCAVYLEHADDVRAAVTSVDAEVSYPRARLPR